MKYPAHARSNHSGPYDRARIRESCLLEVSILLARGCKKVLQPAEFKCKGFWVSEVWRVSAKVVYYGLAFSGFAAEFLACGV